MWLGPCSGLTFETEHRTHIAQVLWLHIHIHTHMHTHTHARTRTHTHAHIHTPHTDNAYHMQLLYIIAGLMVGLMLMLAGRKAEGTDRDSWSVWSTLYVVVWPCLWCDSDLGHVRPVLTLCVCYIVLPPATCRVPSCYDRPRWTQPPDQGSPSPTLASWSSSSWCFWCCWLRSLSVALTTTNYDRYVELCLYV